MGSSAHNIVGTRGQSRQSRRDYHVSCYNGRKTALEWSVGPFLHFILRRSLAKYYYLRSSIMNNNGPYQFCGDIFCVKG